ncbi:MAG: glycosyltransferase [Candidatus Omnitrophica bacterium]|nr:glycosyltransferase [Candidatus Omnitrophota bacterium]
MTNNLPKVSVTIPAYNAEKYIAIAIESVLNQSFNDFELIIVDDCSTDKTEGIVKAFKDKRIKYRKNEKNLGPPGNFNRCIKHSQGEYVYIFHADDIMLKENLLRKVKSLDNSLSAAMIHSNIYSIDKDGRKSDDHWDFAYDKDTLEPGKVFFKRALFSMPAVVCVPSVMVRRSCYEKLGGFNERLSLACELDMWLRISLFFDVFYLAEPLVKYRYHPDNDHKRYSDLECVKQWYYARIKPIETYPQALKEMGEMKCLVTFFFLGKAVRGSLKTFTSVKIKKFTLYLGFILSMIVSLLKTPILSIKLWGRYNSEKNKLFK